MKVRRRAVVLFLGGAFAALSLFASVGATGSMGHLTADIFPNPLRPDIVLPTDVPPSGDPSTTCATLLAGDPSAGDPSAGLAVAPADLSALCGATDTGTGVPAPSDVSPDGIVPDGTYGGARASGL